MLNLKRKIPEESPDSTLESGNSSSNQRNITQRLHHNFIDNGAQRPLFGSRDCNICYINLDLDNIVQSKPCGHTSCVSCLVTYFKKSNKFDCYSCRQNIKELFTTNNNTETPEDFLKRNEKKEEENEIEDLYSQQTFFSPMRRRTYNDYQAINQLYGIPNILIPSILIENIPSNETILHQQEQFIALYDIHSEPFLNKNIEIGRAHV